MKYLFFKLLLCLFLISCSFGEDQKSIYVFDFENILTQEEEDKLNQMIVRHEANTSNEIAVVTTADWGKEENILYYSVSFGDKYGVGKKDKDNGVVIVFSQALRETRITTGYGTEKVLKDEITKKIINSVMIPKFKQEAYFEGIYTGTNAIIDFLEKPENKITTDSNNK